ncbi:hypothetical protein RB628_17460 [Streptomyces sp. ADMS]|uniref:hypothetical protein n=1 Tax=Streptomyces sp. ADMS TaxID=3071415 RepID=UPI00296F6337|nr:hypothetical protein [Streptomyces sp. ADMS]MDW4907087.1 hypothetical protein [Streptomyces sp. ADMS]
MSPIRVSPGPQAHDDALLISQERDRLFREQLPRVRTVATVWRTALGALLAGLVGFSLVKGRSDVSQLATGWSAAAGILLLAALACGAAGAVSLLRASNGQLTHTPVSDVTTRSAADHRETKTALAALRRGITLTLLCTLLLVGAVGATWYGPAAKPPMVQITAAGLGSLCGAVQRIGNGTLLLKSGQTQIAVPLKDLTALSPVADCPEPSGRAMTASAR